MKILLALFVSFLLGIASVQAQWIPQTVPANTGLIRYIDVINANVVWAYSFGNSATGVSRVLRTTDGGITWSAIPVNISGLNSQYDVYSLEALDANTAFIVVTLNTPGNGPATKIFKTTDAGLTWNGIPGVYTGQQSWANFVQFFDANNGLMVGDHLEFYTTSNAGTTWSAVPATNLPAPSATIDFTLDKRTVLGNTIWVPTNGMRIYKSIDKGLTWTVSNTNIPANTPGFGDIIVCLAFQDANNGLASQGLNLSPTTDGGQTWTPVSHSGVFFMHEITHIPGVPNTYVNYSVFTNNPGISITTDNGLNWYQIGNDAHFSAAFFNSRQGWSGGDDLIYTLQGSLLSAPKPLSLISNNFTISPNPTTGIFTVSGNPVQSFMVEVYNLTGLKVKQQQIQPFRPGKIDLSNQPKGMYLLKIISQGQIFTKKVVVQ